jgi:hypothetical protein
VDFDVTVLPNQWTPVLTASLTNNGRLAEEFTDIGSLHALFDLRDINSLHDLCRTQPSEGWVEEQNRV